MTTDILNSIKVGENKLFQITTKFQPKTSPGYDGVSMKLLKQIYPGIIKPLTHIS